MKLLIRILVTAGLVLGISNFMSGISVDSFTTSVIVAVVLALLNVFVKPVLILLTLPFTIVTLGLFLLVVNALVILLCTKIVGGFTVDTLWTALLFSVVLSILQSIVHAVIGDNK